MTYQVQVRPWAAQGDHVLANELGCEVGEPAGCAPETTSNPVAHLVIDKSSDRTVDSKPGDTITYTVTATNDGTGDFTAADPASVVDDLTGVLDDATYGNDASSDLGAAPTYAAPRITWVGALAARRHSDDHVHRGPQGRRRRHGAQRGLAAGRPWHARADAGLRHLAAALRHRVVRPAQADDQEDVQPGPAAGRRPEGHLHGDRHQPRPRRLHRRPPGDVRRRPVRRPRRRDLRRGLDHRHAPGRPPSPAPRSTGPAC